MFISEALEDFDVALSQKWIGCLMPWHLGSQGWRAGLEGVKKRTYVVERKMHL